MSKNNNNEVIQKYFNNTKVKNKSITQIAQAAGVSVSALTRFAKSEGFEGFKDFKVYLDRKEELGEESNANLHLSDTIFSLRRTHDIIDRKKLEFIAKKIAEKRNVIFFGEAFTYITSLFLERKLRKINIQANTLNVASDLGLIMPNPNAVFIFVSNSGKNKNIRKVADKIYASNTKGQIMFSITSNNFSNIEQLVNETVKGYFFESDSINPYELPSVSNLVLTYIFDILFSYVYNIDKEANDKLINAIKIEKEK